MTKEELIVRLEDIAGAIEINVSPEWMYTAIRHCQRNIDFDLDNVVESNRYDGEHIAHLINMLPKIIEALKE